MTKLGLNGCYKQTDGNIIDGYERKTYSNKMKRVHYKCSITFCCLLPEKGVNELICVFGLQT